MFKQVLQKVLGASGKNTTANSAKEPKEQRPLVANIAENLKILHQVFDLCGDVVFREFQLNTKPALKACVIHIDAVADDSLSSQHLMQSILLDNSALTADMQLTKHNAPQILRDRLITLMEVKTSTDVLELTTHILQGNVALLLEGSATALVGITPGGQGRAILEPVVEPVVRGPRDGFVESYRVNVALVRQRLKSSRLKVEVLQVGAISKTSVAVCYLKGVVNDGTVAEVKERIQRIKIDGIIDSAVIEEFISDEPFTFFPLVLATERPDKTASALLEGRVGIIVDTTPVALIVPATFVTMLQASEDSFNLYIYASFIRLLRFVALNLALLLPAIYIAITTYHQEMLPAALLTSIAQARVGVPFPAFIEALIMELTFELLREAGVRLPHNVGQAVSTVGGLVIGQAAVQAGIVSSSMVIVVALTALASFTIPNISASYSIRILRFALMICAAVLGMPGVMLGLMALLIHLCGLRSFGVPYLSPFAPLSPKDMKDTFVRVPWWAMFTRPHFSGAKEPARQDPKGGPQKPGEGGENSSNK